MTSFCAKEMCSPFRIIQVRLKYRAEFYIPILLPIKKGMSLKSYVKQAGGFSRLAIGRKSMWCI